MIDKPIFILTNPRSGSTWLQRVLTSTGEVLIWGESANSLMPVGSLWTEEPPVEGANDLNKFHEKKTDMFMATLLPERAKGTAGYKTLAMDLYGKVAIEQGFPRWGKKETYWDSDLVNFIRQSWPESKIIFLVREFDGSFMSEFRSYTEIDGRDRSEEIRKMASTWVAHTSWMMEYGDLEGCELVKYENLYSREEDEVDKAVIESLLGRCEISSVPKWDDCGTKVSFHVWKAGLDMRSYKPSDLDIIWEYRDEILENTKRLGYSKVLGVTV